MRSEIQHHILSDSPDEASCAQNKHPQVRNVGMEYISSFVILHFVKVWLIIN
nr:MAG TPA: hypothetical protein [Caudoviricetes sp.]